LSVFLYTGCETWSLTLREELRQWVFENGVLRKKFFPRTDELTEEWRILHNEELYGMYCSPHKIRVIKSKEWNGWGMKHEWGNGKLYTGFWWGDLRERRHLEDKQIWEDNIKMGVQVVGWRKELD